MDSHQRFTLQHPEPQEEEAIDLRQYWRIIMDFKYGILGLGIAFAIITALVMMQAEDTYSAAATLLIERSRNNIVSIEELYGINTQSYEYVTTQTELLRSRVLAERVVNDLNLLQHPAFVPQNDPEADETTTWWQDLKQSIPFLQRPTGEPDSSNSERNRLDSIVNRLRGGLGVSQVDYTDLIRISFVSPDPQLAADIANAFANNYIETNLEQRLNATQQANLWLSERLQDVRATLDESERRLQAFLDREQLVDAEGVGSLSIQEIDELTTQSVEVGRARAELESTFRQIQQLGNPTTEELLAFPPIANNEAVRALRSRSDNIAQQIAELSNRYGRNHPRMIALAAEQESVQQNLARQVQQVVASIENDYQAAVDREQAVNARLNLSREQLQEINRKSFELNRLQREVETNRQLYDMFFTRMRETDQTDDLQTTNAILVDPAVAARSPSGPNRRRAVQLALVAGLMLGVGLAFLRNLLDNTVKSPADIEERLNSKTLGLVPYVKAAAPKGKSKGDSAPKRGYLGLLEDNHSRFSESIRTIRTGIALSSIDKPFGILEVTSSIPDEGKTTVAVNLAVALGQLKRTLIIDADMRRPSLASTLGLPPNARGLFNLMAGNAELKECIYRHKKSGIAVLPVGQLPPNPLELLSSEKFRNLLSELRDIYGHIVIDTPPTQTVSDALMVGSLSDATIYVVKADSTPIKVIKSGLDRLQQSNANVLGVVLNQVVAGKRSEYDYGGYYDTYGYSGYKPESA